MGQYWKPINLAKREYIDPHKLGAGLKLSEQLGSHVGTALIILCAAMPERRGGGDLDLDANWHGPERTFPKYNTTPAPFPRGYKACAKRTIGRWAGDPIAIVGDYAKDTDLPDKYAASTLYDHCTEGGGYLDVTDDVCRVIEHELCGRFEGDGWRNFVEIPRPDPFAPAAKVPRG